MKWPIYISFLVIVIVLIIFLVSNNTDKNQNINSMDSDTELMLSDSGWFQCQDSKGQKISFDIKNKDVLNVIDANTLCTSIGKWVKIEGISESRQTGPLIAGHDYLVWIDIDKLDHWPKYINGQKVQAIGILDERYDLPVFVPDPNELPIHSIPVPKGTDMHKASHRYVIQNAIISLSPMTDITEEVPLEVRKLLIKLNGWHKDELDLAECPEKYPNLSSDGETNGWVIVHKRELKKYGYSVKWNSNTKIYELIKED